MRKFGLIGFPLEHSFSPEYFQYKFQSEGINDASYDLYPLEAIENIKELINKHPNLLGLNITIPHKTKIIQLLDKIDKTARVAGSVNTIKIIRDQKVKLIGYNTDVIGFEKSLLNFIDTSRPKALILGNGGSSQSVQFVLMNLGFDYSVVSRTKSPKLISWEKVDQKLIDEHQLIINTTPLGMYPNESSMPPLPYQYLTNQHFLFDLIYNPPFTQFLMQGNNKEASVKNGLEMLELQADAAWDIWNS